MCFNNAWGSVCRNHFGTLDAQVACHQLGFPTDGKRKCAPTALAEVVVIKQFDSYVHFLIPSADECNISAFYVSA